MSVTFDLKKILENINIRIQQGYKSQKLNKLREKIEKAIAASEKKETYHLYKRSSELFVNLQVAMIMAGDENFGLEYEILQEAKKQYFFELNSHEDEKDFSILHEAILSYHGSANEEESIEKFKSSIEKNVQAYTSLKNQKIMLFFFKKGKDCLLESEECINEEFEKAFEPFNEKFKEFAKAFFKGGFSSKND